jgi:hypothetical protein
MFVFAGEMSSTAPPLGDVTPGPSALIGHEAQGPTVASKLDPEQAYPGELNAESVCQMVHKPPNGQHPLNSA